MQATGMPKRAGEHPNGTQVARQVEQPPKGSKHAKPSTPLRIKAKGEANEARHNSSCAE